MHRNRIYSFVIALGVVGAVFAVPSRAAAEGFDLSLNYADLHDSRGGNGQNFKSGGYVELGLAARFLGGEPVFDVSGECEDEDEDIGQLQYQTSWMIYSYMAGVKWMWPLKQDNRWHLNTTLLVGAASDHFKTTVTGSGSSGSSTTSSDTHFAFEPRVGVERVLNNHWGIQADAGLRFIQGVAIGTGSGSAKEFEIGAGVVFHR